jgi:rhodanese-related sulfurtransferase
MRIITAFLFCFLLLAGCKAKESSANTAPNKITAEQAYKMMNEAQNFVILDVRTEAEFSEQRIEGAVLIPSTELLERVEAELPDKNQLIFVYCRSGRRSANAVKEMAYLGYTAVYDFGGIIDWPYETVRD